MAPTERWPRYRGPRGASSRRVRGRTFSCWLPGFGSSLHVRPTGVPIRDRSTRCDFVRRMPLSECPATRNSQPIRRASRRTTTGVQGLCSMHELPVRLGRCRCPARDGRSGTGSDGQGRSCSSGSALPRARAGAGDRGAGSEDTRVLLAPSCCSKSVDESYEAIRGRFPDPAPTLSGRERTRSVDEALQPPKPRAEISRRRRKAFLALGRHRACWPTAVEGGGLPGHIRGSGTCWALGLPPRDVPSSSREATRLSWIPPFVG